MRKVMAILIMGIWAVTVLYLLWGVHFRDIEARMEQFRQARSQWPYVTGKVVEVQFHDADTFDDNDYSYAKVRFEYSVGSKSYSAQQTWSYYNEAQRNAISYRPGQAMSVYYNPANPGKSVIDRNNVYLYEVSAVWETILRILAYPSIIIGCCIIWGLLGASPSAPVQPNGAMTEDGGTPD